MVYLRRLHRHLVHLVYQRHLQVQVIQLLLALLVVLDLQPNLLVQRRQRHLGLPLVLVLHGDQLVLVHRRGPKI